MKTLLSALVTIALAWTASAATPNNDDSCDIALLPAATLLLPYFEVDLEDPNGSTTLFTVTNVTSVDQIARVTLWTDFAYPVINFNIYLTGYDVQSINLYDVIRLGVIAPENGTGTALTQRGHYSDRNHTVDLTSCDRLSGVLDNAYVARMQSAFTEGTVPPIGDLPGCNNVGFVHDNATGYATIDVVRKCDITMPTDAEYWTNDIGYTNALSGDYQHVRRGDRFAEGSPMVHIRAIPENSTPTSFPRTFYSRLQSQATQRLDRRQPLPAVFFARWIAGGPTHFQTFMKVWREAKTDSTVCVLHDDNMMDTQDIVKFDENENAAALDEGVCLPLYCPNFSDLPATSMTSVDDATIYPYLTNGAVAGWVYLNLNRPDESFAAQAWVTASMRAEGIYSVDFDGIAFGNGCSAIVAPSEINEGPATIAPLPNVRTQ